MSQGPIVDPEIHDGTLHQALTVVLAAKALVDLTKVLKGEKYTCGRGHKLDFDPFVRPRLEGMRTMLALYVTEGADMYDKWGASALRSAHLLSRGRYCARQLVRLCRQYISDRMVLPLNPYGSWNECRLIDEDLVYDLNLFLQEQGKDISTAKLLEYLRRPDVKERHGSERDLSLTTARRHLCVLGWRWKLVKKGQYADGHERVDVVFYCQNIYIPRWQEFQ
jgi:hypothetical protein